MRHPSCCVYSGQPSKSSAMRRREESSMVVRCRAPVLPWQPLHPATAEGASSCCMSAGQSAVLTIRAPRDFDLEPIPDEKSACSDPKWGEYCAQGNANGFAIKCFTCVSPDAVRVAEDTIGRMMAECPKPLLQRMRAKSTAVAIIGQDQATHHIPEFRMQRYCVGELRPLSSGVAAGHGCFNMAAAASRRACDQLSSTSVGRAAAKWIMRAAHWLRLCGLTTAWRCRWGTAWTWRLATEFHLLRGRGECADVASQWARR